MLRPKLIPALVLALAVAVLAGCGGGGSTTTVTTPAMAPSTTTAQALDPASAQEAVTQYYGAIDNYAYGQAWGYLGTQQRQEDQGFQTWKAGYVNKRAAEGEAMGIEALRAAVATIFEVVHVSPGNPDYAHPFYLEPEVREALLENIPRTALALPVPENNVSGRGVPECPAVPPT